MTIAIDASRALDPQPTGVELYCLEIIQALLKLPDAKKHQFILLAPAKPGAKHPLASLPAHARWKILPGKHAWTALSLSRAFLLNKELRQSTLFVPGYVLPFVQPKRSVMMVHDLAYLRYPESYGEIRAKRMADKMKRSMDRATLLLTPSKSTKNDLQEFYNYNEQKITVVPHGFTAPKHESAKPNAKLPKPYFLVIGRVEPRKNSQRILDAYLMYSKTVKDPWHLVIVGSPGSHYPEYTQSIHRLVQAHPGSIHELGYVSEQEKNSLLAAAGSLLYPSLYEGFGFPILEAFNANVPVITSDISSMPEVAGDAAIYVDPLKTDELMQAMIRMATDKELRTSLIHKGNKQLRLFSWENAAKETLAALIG